MLLYHANSEKQQAYIVLRILPSSVVCFPAEFCVFCRKLCTTELQRFFSIADVLLDLCLLVQQFSNFFDYGPLFSSGIVGGSPHLLH